MNHAHNGELGLSGNINFGRPATTSRYDADFAFGWGVRPANWEMSAGVQHELVPRVSVGASYFRRWYVNLEVTDNLAVASTDYDTYCVTAPLDSAAARRRRPTDLRPVRLGATRSDRTRSGPFRARTAIRSSGGTGFDFTVNARLQNNLLLQGGVSTGKTLNDNCDVVGRSKTRARCTAARDAIPHAGEAARCLYAAVADPGGRDVAERPGPQITANAVFPNAQIAPSLGRSLSSAANATINLVAPGTLYGERLYQLDLRVGKMFTVGRMRLHGMVDFYNALNANTVLTLNNTYGTRRVVAGPDLHRAGAGREVRRADDVLTKNRVIG